MTYKKNQRLEGIEFKPFEKGMFFASPAGELENLSDVKVLNIAVDTIRQLYKGTIDHQIIRSLDFYSADGGDVYKKEQINTENHLYFKTFNKTVK